MVISSMAGEIRHRRNKRKIYKRQNLCSLDIKGVRLMCPKVMSPLCKDYGDKPILFLYVVPAFMAFF